MERRPVIHTLPGGGRVQVRAETGQKEFMIIFARELSSPGGGFLPGAFPGWAQGSWILTRQRDTGAPSRIRVFLRSDPYTYIQFRPFSEDKCLLDLVLYDAYLVRSLPLPLAFERLYTVPVAEALSLGGERIPRNYFEPDPENYRELRLFMNALRERLPELSFADDGAIDEGGNYVFIQTLEAQNPAGGGRGGLNCSGFAKWVVDGILRPLTGERLPIAPLKAPYGGRGSSFTEAWEELRDPFFGLDWIRNLASRAMSVLRSPSYARMEEFEVRDTPFSELIIRSGNSASLRSYPGFLENAGFGFEGLHPLLYTLAINEPGRIYLGTVSDELAAPVTAGNPRGLPRMRQYFHVAVLIPYFNEYGNFQVAVFESAEETRFSKFKTRYPGHYINLVRIPVERTFDP
jgi:hypothetical protein